ncbi:hypothetical protein JW887_06720 [Candidatus Dojkabacteria bacterium]|nr:hypothetical protein [Candidatus Dojkabacteria bacterium]
MFERQRARERENAVPVSPEIAGQLGNGGSHRFVFHYQNGPFWIQMGDYAEQTLNTHKRMALSQSIELNEALGGYCILIRDRDGTYKLTYTGGAISIYEASLEQFCDAAGNREIVVIE